MSTRYAGDFEFDHGAQFFTARTKAFQAFLKPLIDTGVVEEWRASFVEFDRGNLTAQKRRVGDLPRYVAVPRMSRVGKTLSADLNIAFERTITAIERRGNGWIVSANDGLQSGPYDWLVLTSPGAQTAALAQAFPELVAFCGERRMRGCFALMLGFRAAIELDWQAALVRNADISWVAVNSSKPGRKPPFTLVVHSTNAWADAHMDDAIDSVLEHMLDEAASITGANLRLAEHRQVHRWRYANIDRQSGPSFFLDEKRKLAACGDWCIHGRVEAAFTSSSELAESIAGRL